MKRNQYLKAINQSLSVFPVVGLLGPRQCGKTTLAQQYESEYKKQVTKKASLVHYFDLEDPVDLQRLQEPKTALVDLKGLIIIDEIQRRPDLFPLLRVLVDRYKATQQWMILGSASRDLIQQSPESLAGRISYIEVTPFNFQETNDIDTLWLRGGFPESYLAQSDEASMLWRKAYVKTYLEQDIPNLGFKIAPNNIRRFWMMLSHYHGKVLNNSEIGRSLDLTGKTVRHYVDILIGTFMVRELQPWLANIKKRQVKSPKIYMRDTGILHALLGIDSREALLHHPKLGASWEGLAIEEIIRLYHADPEDCYFWATHAEAELDLMIIKNGKKLGFEFKYQDAPKLTKSMRIAMQTLELDSLHVIYPGDKNYKLAEQIEVISLESYLKKREF